MQVRTVMRWSRRIRSRLARIGSATYVRFGLLARLCISAALFLGFNFLQLGQLSGTARVGRAGRRSHRISFQRGSGCLSSIDWHFGSSVSRCVGFRPFHPFLKSTNAGGAFLRGKPVLNTRLR